MLEKKIFTKNHHIPSKTDYRNLSISSAQISLNRPGHKFRNPYLKYIFQPRLANYSEWTLNWALGVLPAIYNVIELSASLFSLFCRFFWHVTARRHVTAGSNFQENSFINPKIISACWELCRTSCDVILLKNVIYGTI